MTSTNIYLQRYFAPYDRLPDVPTDGVFILPGWDWTTFDPTPDTPAWPQKWEEFDKHQSIVLLGPPRQGKTTEFEHRQTQESNKFLLPLKDTTQTKNFPRYIVGNESCNWTEWMDSGAKGELFIDALDEAKLEPRFFINEVIEWLESLGADALERLRVHLSCRVSDWRSDERSKWGQIFTNCVTLELLNLSREEYKEYCRINNVNPDLLYRQMPARTHKMLARPLTLKMVVDLVKHTKQVPENQGDLYRQWVEISFGESNRTRIDYHEPTPTVQRIRVAKHYAAVTILSARELISSPGGTGPNEVPVGTSRESQKVEKETFETSVFRNYDLDRRRFDEPAIAQYLCAERINELIEHSSLTPKRALKLFFLNDNHPEPIPQLRDVLAWLCSFNYEVRRLAIERNPCVVLFDYPGKLKSKEKLLAWDWLVERFKGRFYFDYRDWESGISALACPEIAPKLTQVIDDPAGWGRDLTRLALEVARFGGRTDLVPNIEKLVLDMKQDKLVLQRAARVLKSLHPESLPILSAWLVSDSDEIDYPLLGTALDLLYPDHITIDQVLKCIVTIRRNRTIIDSYSSFLFELSTRLHDRPEDRLGVIRFMTRELESLLAQDYRADMPGDDEMASQAIYGVLKVELESWREHTRLDDVERALWAAAQMNQKGITFYSGQKEVHILITEDSELRRRLQEIRLLRIHAQEGCAFCPWPYDIVDPFPTVAEDLYFWKNKANEWSQRDDLLLEAALHHVLRAASDRHEGWPIGLIEWFVNLSFQNLLVESFWERERVCQISPWKIEQNQKIKDRIEKEATEKKKFIEDLISHIEDLRQGDFGLLWSLYWKDPPNLNEEGTLADLFGQPIAEAYDQGLQKYWQTAKIPPLGDYYSMSSLNMEFIIVEAVDRHWRKNGADWSTVSNRQKLVALQVGLNHLNSFPEWYQNLVNEEYDGFKELCITALDLEQASQGRHHSLAGKLKYGNSFQSYRQIAFDYLKSNEGLGGAILNFLSQSLCNDKPDQEVVDWLFEAANENYPPLKLEKAFGCWQAPGDTSLLRFGIGLVNGILTQHQNQGSLIGLNPFDISLNLSIHPGGQSGFPYKDYFY